ncbi:MAG: GNAT family N-acetyltransferase [Anaerolineaceae bacterium]
MELQRFDPHIRPINIRRDLAEIANVIEIAFAGQMDAEGIDYLRHIRQIASSVGGFLLDGNTPETSQFPFHGYVWREDNRIIGNLTLIPVRKWNEQAYFIANVAVLPEYRGRGIARALTDRAIAHVKEHQGKQIYLQVKLENDIARHIYTNSGFEAFDCRTTWTYFRRVLPNKESLPEIHVLRRKESDWQQQKEWLREIYPPQIAWNLPYNLERLKPAFLTGIGNFLNGVSSRSWSAWDQDHLAGVATWESGFSSSDYIWLATTPAWEDAAIRALLPVVSTRVFHPQRILINYPYNRGVSAFESCGFKILNTLVWMKKDLQSETA